MSLEKNPDERPHGDAKADAELPRADRIVLRVAFNENLTRGEAQKRIAALEALLDREQHSGTERLPRT